MYNHAYVSIYVYIHSINEIVQVCMKQLLLNCMVQWLLNLARGQDFEHKTRTVTGLVVATLHGAHDKPQAPSGLLWFC